MKLDTQAGGLLRELTARGATGLERLDPADARRALDSWRQLSQPPVRVRRVRDIAIELPDRRLGARLYDPAPERATPTLVYFHGGGFVVGDLESNDHLCRHIAAGSGWSVVSVDYRLAPEHPFPAAVEDAIAAVDCVVSGALGPAIDGTVVAVGGSSAGGNLAAVAAQHFRRAGVVAGQILLYPLLEHEFSSAAMVACADRYLLTVSELRWFWAHYLQGREAGGDPLVSPLAARDVRDVAPALIVTAGFDPLRDQGDAYAARLRHAGVAVEHTCYEDMMHAFMRSDGRLPQADEAIAQVVGFLAGCARRE